MLEVALVILVVILLTVFVWQQISSVKKTHALEGKIAPNMDDLLGPRMRLYDRFVIYFYHPSNTPCRSMKEIIKNLGSRYQNLINVDVTKHPHIAERFQVSAPPVFYVIEKGMIAKVLFGPQTEFKIESLLFSSAD
jgi:thiol-disulfide isomerase/thioredoxin